MSDPRDDRTVIVTKQGFPVDEGRVISRNAQGIIIRSDSPDNHGPMELIRGYSWSDFAEWGVPHE